MRKLMLALLFLSSAAQAKTVAPKETKSLKIVNAKSESSQGPAEWFTGQVRITTVLTPDDSSSMSCASVAFEPGARTAWHTHPKGQLLVVTEGSGLVQIEGQPVRRISVGDTVWTPAGAKHWHGATSTSRMVHTALQEIVNGTPVTWMKKVKDEEIIW